MLEKADRTTISKYVRDAVDRLPPRAMKAVGIGRVLGSPEADTPPAPDYSDRLATTSFVWDNGSAFNVTHPRFGAKGDGVTDDTAAVNAAIAAWLAFGSGVLFIPPGDYKISGPLTVKPPNHQTVPLLVSGYGAKFHLTTATSGWVFQQTSGKSWRHFRIEGVQCIVDSNAVTDAFLWTDGGSPGSLADWVARDLSVETGTATAPINNGIHVSGTSGSNVLYQFLIESPDLVQTTTTGTGILIAGGANISSVEIRNPNVLGYFIGVQIGASGQSITGAGLIGGTIVSAQQEGVKMFTHGGTLLHTHIENSWLTVPTGTQGGELYIEGYANVIGLDAHRQTAGGHSLWAVAVFAGSGVTNLIGRGADPQAGNWARIINTTGNTTGTVNVVGQSISEIDFSSVLTDNTPTISLWQPKTRSDPTFPGAGGAVSPDLSLGNIQFITVTDATPFTINSPAHIGPGMECTLIIFNNTSFAMGAVTLGSAFKAAGPITTPLAGKMRTITFVGHIIHGTLQLIETGRSAADI